MIERKPLTMKPGKVLKTLREGKVATAFKVNLGDFRTIEMAAQLTGVDCVWTDMEHIPNDLALVEKQAYAAKAHDVDIIVRVARGHYSNLIRPLEMDVHGIMIPHIMSLQDAKEVVYYTKFHPIGRRPMDGGNADGIYGNISRENYTQQANQERFNILQIEDPEPLDELEEIIALEGVDMVFFGFGDFSQGLGEPGNFNHPKIAETRKRIGDLAMKHGKVAGTVCGVENFESVIKEGYRFFNIGADVKGLSMYFNQIYQSLLDHQDLINHPEKVL